MVHFYHLDPERILTLPVYLLDILVEYLPALDAYAQQNDMVVALAPHMEVDDRKRILDRLEDQASVLQPEPAPIEVETYDPDAARAYFAARGIKTT